MTTELAGMFMLAGILAIVSDYIMRRQREGK